MGCCSLCPTPLTTHPRQAPMPQAPSGPGKSTFVQAVETAGKYVSQVNELQNASDASIQDLLTGKNNDITSVVSAVAKRVERS